MDPKNERNIEAMLAAAGCPAPPDDSGHCDFHLEKATSDTWRITPVSDRARTWLKADLCSPLSQSLCDSIVVDTLGTDRFLKTLRSIGFSTEFVSTGGMDRF